MVLSIHWLIQLGPILWDFKLLRMEFSYNRRKDSTTRLSAATVTDDARERPYKGSPITISDMLNSTVLHPSSAGELIS